VLQGRYNPARNRKSHSRSSLGSSEINHLNRVQYWLTNRARYLRGWTVTTSGNSQLSFLNQPLRLSINPALLNKNEAGDKSLFVQGWQNLRLTPTELAEQINRGIAYCCELSGARAAHNFVASSVLSVDMDGNRRIADVMEDPLIQRCLTILYTTARHTDQVHRFRLVFALPRAIETACEMAAAMRSLSLRISGDLAATDAARIFYGSRGSQPEVFDRGIDEELLAELIDQGLDADQRDSVGPGTSKPSTVSRLAINPDLVVRLPSGEPVSFASLGAKRSVCCPFHADRNASAHTVKSGSNEAIGLHCSTCSQTFWPAGSTAREYDFHDFDRQVAQVVPYFNSNEDMGPLHDFLFDANNPRRKGLLSCNVQLTKDDFLTLPTKLPDGITFVKSPKGTGKTEAIKRVLEHTGGSVLLVGHRVTLIRQSCERLGLDCYLDHFGSINSRRLGICLDSLRRLKSGSGCHKCFDTVIVDESEQVAQHFLSGTIDAAAREEIFILFRHLLQRAKRIVALDADLGWLTFETFSKLAQPEDSAGTRPSHIHTNEVLRGSPIDLYRSYHHLVGDLMESVAQGMRVFVTSNSKRLIDGLSEGVRNQLGDGCPIIAITSDSKDREDCKRFVLNPAKEALQYRAILTTPCLATGVDITFPDRTKHIDVVYGFFESNITTHFDIDQQLARVRDPGTVRVWINPRRFRFETSVDVVKRDIQVQGLYKNVLRGYDDDGRPIYHTDDPLIDMAALAVSQQRASKNDLRRNFMELKKRQGHVVNIIEQETDIAANGRELDSLGRILANEKRAAALLSATSLHRTNYEDVEHRMETGDTVDDDERWRFARTRIEKFYREPLTRDLIDSDDRGRLRARIIRFESLENFIEARTSRESLSANGVSERYGLSTRFLRSDQLATNVTFDLLSATPLFDGRVFDTARRFSLHDLTEFSRRCGELDRKFARHRGQQLEKISREDVERHAPYDWTEFAESEKSKERWRDNLFL
jgi:hypothetical protein